MRVLITGATGFVGGHLIDRLLRDPLVRIVGLSRTAATLPFPPDRVALRSGDLLDRASLAKVISATPPDWIFHLAGYASPGKSFSEPAQCWADNLTATINLLDAVAASGTRPRVLVVSSGLVYGDPDGPDDAFDESRILRPASPYAASKAAADLAAYQATRSPGLDVVRVRAFNHIGPRQSADYAVANFARQVAAVALGRQRPVIETGDLSARRDLTDVRDIVDAYVRLLERGRTGEVYNVGSGRAYPMEEILHHLINRAGVAVEVRQAVDPHRRKDTAVSRCDPSKLKRECAWEPQFSLEQTLGDMLDDWKSRHEAP